MIIYYVLIIIFLIETRAKVLHFNDTGIHYFGRWKRTDSDIQSVSPGAYLKTTVPFGTMIKFKLSQPATSLFIQINNDRMIRREPSTDFSLTLPSNGSIVTLISDINSSICLSSIEIPDHPDSYTPLQTYQVIEFVGHDLTLGLGTSQSIMTSFPSLVSNLLGTERSPVAFPGAWLTDRPHQALGMETQYFVGGESFFVPQIITILLGAYDHGAAAAAAYSSHLSTFLFNIQSRFPQATILVLSEPLGILFQESQAAVHRMEDFTKIYFVDTTGWVRYGPTHYLDPLHFNDVGQERFAHRLAPLLKAKLAGLAFPGPAPNPNLPPAWQTMDVGQESSMGLVGSVSFDSASMFTVWGSGQQEAFKFVYQPLSGHGSIEATVLSHSTFASCAKAGILMRENLSHNASFIQLGFSPQHGIFMQQHQGNITAIYTRRLSPPYRLRLERRKDNTVIVQIAHKDARSWETWRSIQNFVLAQDIYVGLSVTSCDPAVVSVAKFADVTLSGGVGGDGSYYHRHLVVQE